MIIHHTPELGPVFLDDDRVPGIRRFGLPEEGDAGRHHEQDHSQRKDIGLDRIIGPLVDFGRHAVIRAHVVRALAFADLSDVPQINDLELHLAVHHKVFQLQVSVGVALLMQVLDSAHELMEVFPRHSFFQSVDRYIVIEISPVQVFHHQNTIGVERSIGQYAFGLGPDVMHLEDVWVAEVFKDGRLFEDSVLLLFSPQQKLYGILLTLRAADPHQAVAPASRNDLQQLEFVS